MSKVNTVKFCDFEVEVVDSVSDYVTLMKEIYDFESIKAFFKANPTFRVLFDGMHGGKLFMPSISKH